MKMKLIVSLLLLCLVFAVGLAQAQIGGRGCEPITFSNVPPSTFECMKTKLQDYGIYVPPGDSGELSGKGIVANFEWDGKSALTIQVTRKPSFVSCSTADNEIGKFVDQCQFS